MKITYEGRKLICSRCEGFFASNEMVSTWTGDAWITTCPPCNRAAHQDKDLCARISANHMHALWTTTVAWDMAADAARAYADVRPGDAAGSAGAAGRLNALVELIARLEHCSDGAVLLAVFKRANMRLVPASGDQNGSGTGGVGAPPASRHSPKEPAPTQAPQAHVRSWPVRGEVRGENGGVA